MLPTNIGQSWVLVWTAPLKNFMYNYPSGKNSCAAEC